MHSNDFCIIAHLWWKIARDVNSPYKTSVMQRCYISCDLNLDLTVIWGPSLKSIAFLGTLRSGKYRKINQSIDVIGHGLTQIQILYQKYMF